MQPRATPSLANRLLRLLAALGLIATTLAWGAGPALAAAFVVNSTADVVDLVPGDGLCDTGNTVGVDPECTLRAAIQEANFFSDSDTITLPSGTYTLTITGTGDDNAEKGDLDIIEDLTINGAGAATTIVQAGTTSLNGIDRVFQVKTGVVTITDVTVRHGQEGDGAGFLLTDTLTLEDVLLADNTAATRGGGVYVDGSAASLTLRRTVVSGGSAEDGGGVAVKDGTLVVEDSTFDGNTGTRRGGGLHSDTGAVTIDRSTFSGNSASSEGGGGIYNRGGGAVLNLTNSTLSGNSAGSGGGLFNEQTATLLNVTVTNNTAATAGGGIHVDAGMVNAKNTIVAGNTGGNCQNAVSSQGYNIEDTDTCIFNQAGDRTNTNPQLGSLADNGGYTETHALLVGSPAIDTGANSGAPTVDQRGETRPMDGDGNASIITDVGAYELDPDTPVAVNDSAATEPDVASVIDVLGNDADPLGEPLTVDSVTQGANGTVVNNGTDVTYTPDPAWTGVDSFTYVATDGTFTDQATVTVTVAPYSDPMAIWRRSTQSTPFYNQWNGSSFTGTQTSQGVGEWKIIQGAEAPTRDEAIVLGVDDGSGDVTGEMWNGSAWSALTDVNPLGNMSQTFWWGFDVAYEPGSGDAVVVSTDGGSLKSWVWNGSGWSGPSSLTLPVAGTPRHLQLAAHPYEDEMVLIVSNSNSQDYAYVWDGSNWGNSITLDGAGAGDRTDVYVAYEKQSGNALVVYGKGTDDVHYRRWTASGWDASESTLTGIGGGYARWTTLGADPGSDRIALGVLTNDNDVWLAVWDGSGWLDQTTVTTSTTEPAVAVAFEGTSGQALATYGESVATPRYRVWTDGFGWSPEASLPSVGAIPNSQMLFPEPGTDGVMLGLNDDGSDIHFLYWDGTSWSIDHEVETSSGDTKNQPFHFLWNGVVGPSTACGDLDGDGLCDVEEDANTDADGNPATNPGPDTDGDLTSNYLDADDDGDGTPTASENADPNADGDPRDALDSDRDGQPDYLDAPTVASGGTVGTEQKISDIAGGLTAALDDADAFGSSVAGIGDLDDDGINDVVVGAHYDGDGGTYRGALYVLFLNANGTVKAEQKISDTVGGLTATLDNFDRFGTSVTAIGDLDGDGINDIAVGAQRDDDGGTDRGAVHILFLNANGTVKAEQKISDTVGGLTATLDDLDRFGTSVTAIGDLDGDGINDIAVGAHFDDDGGSNRGAVYILLLNADGTVKAEQKLSDTAGGLVAPLSNTNLFGNAVSGIGDLDGDGILDLAVGAPEDDDGGSNRGAVYVLFLNADGTVKAEQKISDTAGGLTAAIANSDLFGTSVSGIGDLDDDGVADLAVGAIFDDDGGTDRGAVYVLFLNADGTVKAEEKISDVEGGLAAPLDDADRFGHSVAGVGDLDGDGLIDLAVGALLDDDGGTDRGAVYVLHLSAPNAPPVFDQDLLNRSDPEATLISLSAEATDPETDPLVYSATGLPLGLSIDSGTGLISGVINHAAAASSPYATEVSVTDGVNPPATDTFSWTVTNVAASVPFVVAGSGGAGGGDDWLSAVDETDFSALSNEASIGIGTGTSSIEAIAVHPTSGVVYGVDGGQFGSFDVDSGVLNPIGSGLGTAGGSFGELALDDVRGLAFHPLNDSLYGIHRRAGGDDVLFRVDIGTGAHVPNAFLISDYSRIRAVGSLDDATSLAIDPDDWQLYAVLTDGGSSELVTVSLFFGFTNSAGVLAQPITGLSFDSSGQLWGTSPGALYQIDNTTGALDAGRTLDNASNYRSVSFGLVPALPPAVEGTVFDDVAANALAGGEAVDDPTNRGIEGATVHLYQDLGTLGEPDAADSLWGSTTTGPSGHYYFAGFPAGPYWIVVDSTTVTPNAGGTGWAEQTFGPAGSLIDASFTQSGAAGPVYSGMQPTVSDAAGIVGAEHVAYHSFVGGETVDHFDFGFSFNVVTNLEGGDAGSPQGSLRQFITNANGVTGPNVMRFVPAVPTNATDGGGRDWWSVPVTVALPGITGADTTIDGTAFDAADGVALLDPNSLGPELELNGTGTAATVDGLLVTSGSSTVSDLVINRFGRDGIRITTAGGDTIAGNYIGTDATGTADLGNIDNGIFIISTPSNTIGGLNPADRNVISGNNNNGILVDGPSASLNTIIGNFVGTNAAGTAAIPNTDEGVDLSDAPSNTIGGTTPAERNVISGNNWRGVGINDSDGNFVTGNYIGTDMDGTSPLGNGVAGVYLLGGSSGNIIGGSVAGAGNVISGNSGYGVEITGSGTDSNTVAGNYIGTDESGTADVGNSSDGVAIRGGAQLNKVGGIVVAARNIISGNNNDGVWITGSGTDSNAVQGNWIGFGSDGSDLGNSYHGVAVENNASNNLIGGPLATQANRIGHNAWDGVAIAGGTGTGNAVIGNSIVDNTGLGIDFENDGITPNDPIPGDGDSGPNGLLNFPEITSATESGGTVTLTGVFDVPAGDYRFEFFKNPSGADLSGNGEGETIAGSAPLSHTAFMGDEAWGAAFPGAVGDIITATITECTDAGCTAFLSTSEFSTAVTVTSVNTPPVANDDVSGAPEDGVAVFNVKVNDTDTQDGIPTGPATVVTQPLHGSAVANAGGTGTVTYTPDPDYFGPDWFTYTIDDSGGLTSNVATVTIAVAGFDDPPTATDDGPYSVLEDGSLVVDAQDQQFSLTWGTAGAGNGQFAAERGIAIAPDGSVYVADTGNHRIQKFDSSGTYLLQWGSSGTGNGQFNNPMGVDVAADGTVYVSDLFNDRIQYFDPSGVYLGQFGSTGTGNGQLDSPRGIDFGPDGNLYVADAYNYRIQVFTPAGAYLRKWGSSGTGNGQFDAPRDLVVDALGDVFVADSFNDRIQKFDSSGAYLLQWGTSGAADGQFSFPRSVEVNAAGDIFVSDSFNDRVQIFDSSGTFLSAFGTSGTGDGEFTATYGLAFGPNGDLYVGDVGNNRVQRFAPIGLFGNDTDPDFPLDTLTATVDTDVANGTLVLAPDGNFTYTPDPDYFGPDSFVYQVCDTSPACDTATVTIVVDPVNDEPSFTPGANVGLSEDNGAVTIPGWATAITAGPGNESAQTLTFNITGNTNSGLFSTGPAIDSATGNLSFTPAAQAFGAASITIELQDNGGTTDGGDDISGSAVFTITVTSVNDAPSFTAGAAPTVDEDSGAYSAPWASAISPGPANEAGQTVSFNVTGNTNPGLFAVTPAIDGSGTLTFTPAADAFGTVDITVEAQDDGGVASGGVDTSSPVVFTITVDSVNDAPSFTSGGNVGLGEDSGPTTVSDWATAMSAGPANESGQTLTFNATGNTNPGLFSAGPVLDPVTGNLTFTTAADQNGSANITVELQDNGGIANGGDDTSPPVIFTITVNPANDPPVLDPVGPQSGDEGTLIGFTATAADIDAPANTLTFSLEDGLGSVPPGAVITAGGVFTWTPTEAQGPGVYSFDVVVTDDGAGLLSDRETISVTVTEVNVAPVLDPVGAQSGAEGTLIGFTATTTDSDVPGSFTFTLEDGLGSVPAGAVITAGGVFTFTPTEAQGPGVYSFDVVVTDNTLLEDRETITVTVTEANIAPVLDPVGAQSGDEGTLIGFTATATDSDVPGSFTFTLEDGLGSVPVGAVITAGGVFTFTPSEVQGPGVYSFDVVVTDNTLLEDRETITVTVTEANIAPALDPVGPQSGDEGTVIGFAATAADTDAPANTLTFTLEDGLGSVPAGAVMTAGGVFTFTPSEAQGPGVYSFDVVVTDDGAGLLEDRETITVTVNEVNVAPVLDPVGGQSGDEGTLIGFTATAADIDAPANTLTFSLEDGLGSVPPGAVITAGGVFTWTPTEAQGPGVYSFDVVVTDDGAGLLSDRETISVTVTEVNVAPVLDPVGAQSGAEGTLIGFTATTTDSDVPGSFTFTLEDGLGSVPAGAVITAGGVFTFTPTEAQGPGVYSFDVVVTDNTLLEDRETITVTVTEANIAPVLDPVGAQSGAEGTVIGFTATATDADAPANTLTFSLEDGAGSVPPGAVITAGGVFTFTPTEAQGPGVYSFDVVVTDDGAGLLSDWETISVTVTEVNVAPVLDPVGAQSGAEGTLIGFTATTTDSDVPGSFTFTLEDGLGSVPAGAVITAGGVFTFTPTEAQGPGVYSFDVVVTDNTLLEDRETITVTVTEANIAPVLDPVGAQSGAEGTVIGFTATAADTDAPANTLTFTLEDGLGLVPAGAVVTAGGVFTFTPTEAQGPGVYTFDVVVTDDGAGLLSDRETITVTVTEVNVAPVLDPVGAQSGAEGTVIGFTATAADTDAPANTLTFTLEDGLGLVPAGAVVTAGGVFTFTPTEAQGPGVYTFDVVVTDDGAGLLSDRETITVTVNEVDTAPVLDPVGAQSGDEGTLIGFTATTTDSDVPGSFTFTVEDGLGSVPAGAVITAGGVFTFTPTEAQGPGVYSFDVVVTDNTLLEDRETITVTVNEVDTAPVLDPVGAQSGAEGTLIGFTATTTDSDVPGSFTFTLEDGLGSVPAGAVITAGGVFTFTPTEAQGPGVYSFDVVVTDNTLLEDRETITVTVTEANIAPVLDPVGAQSGAEGTVIGFTATAADTDAPANTLTFTLEDGLGLVPAGAVVTAGGVFTFTPTEAQGPGVYTFDVVVTDDGAGLLSDRETITVTVNEVNVAPVLDPVGNQTIDELALLFLSATATDVDQPPNGLTFTLEDGAGSVPSGASITAGGVFAFTPSEAQGPGVYVFDVVVTDDGAGLLSDRETITVTVGEANSDPVLDPVGAQSGGEGTLIGFTATASDTDLPADSLTFTLEDGLGSVPAGAAITAGGVFTWTPTEAQGPGVYSFDVVVTDDGAGLLTDRETITVTVNEVDIAPVLDPVGGQSGDEGTLIGFTATATDSDVPGSITFTLEDGAGSVPTGAVMTAGGVFTFTPTEAQGPGVYSFDVVVTDNTLLGDRETITITVTEANIAPTLNPLPNPTQSENTFITFTAVATDSDLPANSLLYSLVGAPAGATINSGSGAFGWIPTEAQGPGVYTFDVVVTDNGIPILTDTDSVTITVTESNRDPVLDPIGPQSGDEGTAIAFTATATDLDQPANGLVFSLAGEPAGASISAGGSFSWTPTEAQGPGLYSFDVIVTDDGIPAATDTETITVTVDEVNETPVLDPIGPQSGDEGVSIGFTATASDSDQPANVLIFSLSGQPPGASMTVGGVFTWTPTENQGPGLYSFDVVVTDDGTPNREDRETITVAVDEVDVPPTLNPVGDRSVDEGSLLVFSVTSSDPDVPSSRSYSLEDGSGSVPAGAGIDPLLGLFGWSTTEADGPGAYTFDVVVTDNAGLQDRETITVTVSEINQTPVLAAIGPQSGDEATAITFTATATDTDQPANSLAFSLSGEPAGAAITAGGAFTWTPTEAQGPGAYTFDVVVTDDGSPPLSHSETITVTVAETNSSPVLNPIGASTVDEQSLLTFAATAVDPDVPVDTLVFSLIGAPAGATIEPATGAFAWTPTEAQGPSVYSFDVEVADSSGAIDSETIVVTVAEVNDVPIITDPGDQVGGEGLVTTLALVGSDPDEPVNALTWSATGLPTGLTIDPVSGLISGVVALGAAADSPFAVSVGLTDDGLPASTGSVDFNWTIAVNTPPSTAPDFYEVVPGGTLTVGAPGVLGNDLDADGDDLVVTVIVPPSAGSLGLNPAGGFTYSHNGGATSEDVFVYQAADGRGGLTLATVKISILEPNLPPILISDFLALLEDGFGSLLPLANDSDPNGDLLSLVEFGQPEVGFLVAGEGGSLLFTPPANFFGEVTASYTAADGNGGLSTGIMTFLVEPVNDLPIGQLDVATLSAYLPFVLDVLSNDRDVDGDSLRLGSVLGATAGEVGVNPDGTITYRPAVGFVGTDTFQYVLMDAAGGVDTVTVRITVPAEVLSAAIARGDTLGSPALGFQAPPADLADGPTITYGLAQGVSLLADAFFQSLGALQLPILFLGLALGTVLVLGGFTELPMLLAGRRRRFYSVVLLDREHRLAARAEPGPDEEAVYFYEPTAAGFQSLDKPARENGRTWIPVESPNGAGWVEMSYLTETVDLQYFLDDAQPVAMLKQLARDLTGNRDVTALFGNRGLAVALGNDPEMVPGDALRDALANRHASADNQRLWDDVLDPLGEALRAAEDLDSRGSHSRNALIPVELWNFQYLAVNAEGHPPWLVYFEYVKGKPRIVGIGLDL